MGWSDVYDKNIIQIKNLVNFAGVSVDFFYSIKKVINYTEKSLNIWYNCNVGQYGEFEWLWH